MLGTSRRSAVLSALGICFLVTIWLSVGRLQDNPLGSIASNVAPDATPSTYKITSSKSSQAPIVNNGHLLAPVSTYFNQVFLPETETRINSRLSGKHMIVQHSTRMYISNTAEYSRA